MARGVRGVGLASGVALLAALPLAAQQRGPHPLLHKAAPELRLRDTEGRERTLAQFKGMVVVVSFTASWCRASNGEAPKIEERYQAYRGRGIQVLGVATAERQDAGAHASAFKARHGLTYPVLVDAEQQALKHFTVRSYPTQMVVDRAGTVRSVQAGFEQKALDAAVAKALR